MVMHETTLRVRYAETDQMGVVYHDHFLQYFEAARGDMIRAYGMSYRDLEAAGVLMPVTEVNVKYLRPIRYDELITLRCIIDTPPGRRVTIRTEVMNEEGRKCVEGAVELAFVDAKTGKSVDAPEVFINILKPHWRVQEA